MPSPSRTSTPPPAQLGAFTAHGDVAERAAYDAEADTYTLSGPSATSDAPSLLYRHVQGNVILTADAAFASEAGPDSILGWTVRSGLDPSAASVTLAVHGDGRAVLAHRPSAGGEAHEQPVGTGAPDVLRLERRGGVYTASVARRGEPFRAVELEPPVDLGDEVVAGLLVAASGAGAEPRAVFSNVRLTVPAAPDFRPYHDYIGARLETLDVETGRRRVVLATPEPLQAPNWTPDGEALIVNQNGRMYRVRLADGAMTEIPLDFATDNNNDHVLSPDGRRLGISHHAADHDGASIVYTVPVEGGTPRQVTPQGPSYLHGWSPDGSTLIYTGGRGGRFDIYAIPTAGGEERRLTNAPGLHDGSEFSPDGAWIYFNSTQSGRMQIWRMRPDGADPERVTQDGFNNWFPHVSPDGRWIAFLTYEDEIDPDDHPWYKRVYLRLMPAGGGEPRVIAYLYGGQGTINVPSWSPDSRRLAFVSNTATV